MDFFKLKNSSKLMKTQCFANCMGSALQKDIIFDKKNRSKNEKNSILPQ